MYEIVNFLQHTHGEDRVLVMSDQMGWLFFLFYLNYHLVAIGLYAFSTVEGYESTQSLTAVLGGVCVGVAFGQLAYLVSLAMRLQSHVEQIPSQIQRFHVENAGCLCCGLSFDTFSS